MGNSWGLPAPRSVLDQNASLTLSAASRSPLACCQPRVFDVRAGYAPVLWRPKPSFFGNRPPLVRPEAKHPGPGRQLTVSPAAVAVSVVVPAIIADAGDHAARRFLEFFWGLLIRNKTHCPSFIIALPPGRSTGATVILLGVLADIEPLRVAAYIETMQTGFEKPSVKQHLAAIRMLFDWLVTGQIVATNPAHAVRGPKHVVKTGKTTVLDAEQARRLLDSIDTSTVVGLHDRALISVMTFAFARIGAVVAMHVEDYYPKGKRWWVRLHEKDGKRHEMPAHHNLEEYLDTYIREVRIGDQAKGPLFRSAAGRTGLLTEKAMNRIDAWRMIQRRAAGEHMNPGGSLRYQ